MLDDFFIIMIYFDFYNSTKYLLKGFSASSVKKLFFGTTEPLGDLLFLRIWHDNSGPPGYQSWFLDKVIIDDLQSRDRYLHIVL